MTKIAKWTLLSSLTGLLLAPVGAQALDDPSPSYRASVDENMDWPDPDRATRKQGAFVPANHVLKITPGMKKSQIYTLLDVPHFHEGLFGVKKWNYILNFYTGSGDDYVSCQYQIRYDKDMRVESTHWRTQQCADLVNMPAKVAAVAPQVVEKVVYVDRPTPAAPATRPVNRGYVVTFDTGSAVLDGGDIEILETAVAAAKQAGSSSLSVVGHTDTVGSESYNRALREKRSKAVASALKIIAANGGTEVSVSTSTSPDLAVPTGDETPEEANRRVTVYVN